MIVAYVGVKDEVDLIDKQIKHLHGIGVGHVIVVDSGSTDGTSERLRDHAAKGSITLIEGFALGMDSAEQLRKRYEASLAECNPDWILIQDADDFIVPECGDIREALRERQCDVVRLERFNVPVVSGNPAWPAEIRPETFGELKLYSDPIENFREYLAAHPDTPWIRGKVQPKIAARPGCVKGVKMGGHDIIPMDGATPSYETALDILVAHVPISSYERFRWKAENIRKLFSNHGERFGEAMAWHWKRWLLMFEKGGLLEEYQRQCLAPEDFALLESEGRITSAAAWFAASAG